MAWARAAEAQAAEDRRGWMREAELELQSAQAAAAAAAASVQDARAALKGTGEELSAAAEEVDRAEVAAVEAVEANAAHAVPSGTEEASAGAEAAGGAGAEAEAGAGAVAQEVHHVLTAALVRRSEAARRVSRAEDAVAHSLVAEEEAGARVRAAELGVRLAGLSESTPPRTKWTRRVPHPVLIGHAASLSQESEAGVAAERSRAEEELRGAGPAREVACGSGAEGVGGACERGAGPDADARGSAGGGGAGSVSGDRGGELEARMPPPSY